MTDNAMLNEVLKLQSLMKSGGLETAKALGYSYLLYVI